jgi:diacylglycerol kinase family enzyme
VSPAASPITVVLNRSAGTKQQGNQPEELADLFRTEHLAPRILTTASAAEADEAARAAIAAGAAAVVAAGGDGTIRAVASPLAGSNVPFGVIPLGTFNHFAKDLRIPLDHKQAVQAIANGHVKAVDVGEVNDRIFLNNSSIGIYPNIVVERERLRGLGYSKWMGFAQATLRILRHYRGVVVRVNRGSYTETTRTPFLFVGNNEYRIDGLRMGGRTRLDGGELFACLAPRLHARDLPALFARALAGRAGSDALESFAAAELHVGTPRARRLRVALDGEVELLSTPLVYRVRPRALNVIVPAA